MAKKNNNIYWQGYDKGVSESEERALERQERASHERFEEEFFVGLVAGICVTALVFVIIWTVA